MSKQSKYSHAREIYEAAMSENSAQVREREVRLKEIRDKRKEEQEEEEPQEQICPTCSHKLKVLDGEAVEEEPPLEGVETETKVCYICMKEYEKPVEEAAEEDKENKGDPTKDEDTPQVEAPIKVVTNEPPQQEARQTPFPEVSALNSS